MRSGTKTAVRDFAPSPRVDAVMAAERAASFTKRSIKTKSKMAGLKLALSMLDLTTLEGKDSPEKVRALCAKAVKPGAGQSDLPEGLPSVGAVCVYPNLVKHCRDSLEAMGALGRVKIASVATGFPSGQYPLDVRLDDTRRAIHDGADEIDMVINRGAFLAGRYDEVADEIRAVKRTCLEEGVKAARHDGGGKGRPISLKVILETGELETLDNVRFASDIAIRAMDEALSEFGGAAAKSAPDQSQASAANGTLSNGSYESQRTLAIHPASFDFIKTSTGKVTPAATMPVTLVMLEAVRDWYLETGKLVGVKPAGGIRTAKQSLHYLVMVKETLGALPGVNELHPGGWLTPELWRFGASALANDILRQISWLHSGKYRANYDVTEA
ncbi:MAG: 2-deoxyribose-5-phosphate aldolase [Phycisphaeraceae bacterium]|nr:2-deoxyribose-5-phosphate aldolase [Phycisphaeraceae bacterium]